MHSKNQQSILYTITQHFMHQQKVNKKTKIFSQPSPKKILSTELTALLLQLNINIYK